MSCSASRVPGRATGVDATLREGAQISSAATGEKLDRAIAGSTVSFHVIDPLESELHAPIAGAKLDASGYHSPTTPSGKRMSTRTSTRAGDQKYSTGVSSCCSGSSGRDSKK